MSIMRVSVFLFLLIMMVELIYPHPVIWKGGQVINSVFKENQLHLNYHYSLTNKHAIFYVKCYILLLN